MGEARTKVRIEQGRKRIVRIKNNRREEWAVWIPDHHEAYISWGVYESNQEVIAHNANGKGELVRGSVKRGGALLAGLLRSGHCGAKLLAQYPGPTVIRYQCAGYILDRETSCCVGFGGLSADRLVAEQVFECLKPLGLQAALQAIENLRGDNDERIQHKQLALQQARYEVAHARRQYDAVDPSHRLVAGELERRWNEALKLQAQLEEELVVLKQIIATSHGDTVRLVLHWQGGAHTELTLQKTPLGKHRYVTDTDTIELIRSLARIQPDAIIASILNRIGCRTAHGKSWNPMRVCSVRNNHAIEVYREGERQARGELTVSEVASMLGVTETTVLRMIRQKHLPATHACMNAPWILLKEEVEKYIAASRRAESPQTVDSNQLVFDIQ